MIKMATDSECADLEKEEMAEEESSPAHWQEDRGLTSQTILKQADSIARTRKKAINTKLELMMAGQGISLLIDLQITVETAKSSMSAMWKT